MESYKTANGEGVLACTCNPSHAETRRVIIEAQVKS
jgi:hypothetical protein